LIPINVSGLGTRQHAPVFFRRGLLELAVNSQLKPVLALTRHSNEKPGASRADRQYSV
jgi:hypothetical protein